MKTKDPEIAAGAAGGEGTSAGASGSKTDAGSFSRRSLCYGIGGAAVLLAMGGLKVVGTQPAVRPPGGQDEDALIAKCLRCQKCYEACPRDAIKPAHIELGLLSARTPVMDFSSSWCDWCAQENGGIPRCVDACPTGALSLVQGATDTNTILGKAAITQDWCLGYKLSGCKYCYDACPYEAIELDVNGRPHVIAERCNGCGACEAACVSLSNGSIAAGMTHKAIVVEPTEK